MRLIAVLVVGALLSAACGGDQPPAVPGSGGTASAPAPEIPAPADADLFGAPRPDDEDLQELYDVARDLLAVARSESGAVADLSDDLARFAQGGDPAAPKAVAERVGRALQGRNLDEASARRIAILLYVAMNAHRITPEQRTAAAAQLRQLVTSVGANAADADAVASQIR